MRREFQQLSETEINRAYELWRHTPGLSSIDERFQPFIDLKNLNQRKDWLVEIRTVSQLNLETVSKLMGISKSALSKIESRETNGDVSLEIMQSVGNVLGYDFIYGFKPKSNLPVSRLIWNQLLASALKHPWLKACDQKRRHLALKALVNKYINDTEFRKAKGWSQRKFEKDATYTLFNAYKDGRWQRRINF